jgi:small subunit ribosomal protein S8e
MKQGRKSSGGKLKKTRKTKLFEKIGIVKQVTLGSLKKKSVKTMGGHYKSFLLRTDKVNVFIKKEKKCKMATIKNVKEVPSNPFLARKNVIVKGAILETDLGKVRVTNRPGQEACVQGTLIV